MMRSNYSLIHWVLTILIAPFTSQAIEYIWGKNPYQVVGLFEMYPITVLFSIMFSLPTFAVYLLCFFFLSKYNVHWITAKLTLIGVTVTGICITQLIIGGSMTKEIILAYGVTGFVTGLLCNLKAKTINTASQ